MTEQFVPYELAVKLKALGFDEPCVAFYEQSKRLSIGFNWLGAGGRNSNLQECTAPLYQQAFRWFREKYSIYGMILPSYADSKEVKDRFFYEVANGKKIKQELEYHTTYEEAELACLNKLIEIVETKSE